MQDVTPAVLIPHDSGTRGRLDGDMRVSKHNVSMHPQHKRERRTTTTIKHFNLAIALLWHFCDGFVPVDRRLRCNTGPWTTPYATHNNHVVLARYPTTSTAVASISRFPDDLVGPLDLIPLLHGISNHAGTRRGRQALLALVGQDSIDHSKIANNVPARRRRVVMPQYKNTKSNDATRRKRHSEIISLSTSIEEARKEYNLIEEALLALDNNPLYDEETANLVFPPLYAAGSSPDDTSTCPDTDDDDWMSLPLDELSLEHVLQAEQVLITLLQVKQWAEQTDVSLWLPTLSDIGKNIPHQELLPVLHDIGKAVEISRVRSLTDPDGRVTFVFRLSGTKFPHLKTLRATEQQLVETMDREMKTILRKTKGSPEYLDYEGRKVLLVPKSAATPDLGLIRGSDAGRCYVEPRSVIELGDELADIQQAVASMELHLEQDLIATIVRAQPVIDAALQIMARVDVIFARAAFGRKMGGSVPTMGQGGCISIPQFVHPVLALDSFDSVVPTDLHLADDMDDNLLRSLIISGPNGGGKSVAMKSFGVASMLTKMSVPIPHRSKSTPRVDFFPTVLVEIGDQQSLSDGESTFMAKINACSRLIQQVQRNDQDDSHTLILLDELGSGTDPAAGGAIGQAILETLFENNSYCRIVSTTHSPRLKALSFNDSRFNCATVMLKRGIGDYKLPSYELQYGLIGDSYALGAASRSVPPLPDEVIARAASLLTPRNENGEDDSMMTGSMLRALTASLERQVDEAMHARQQVENVKHDLSSCRDVMLTMARSYETKFTEMERRLDSILQNLKDDKDDRLEVIGDTLVGLRIAKKKVKSEIDRLREQGLKPVSIGYEFVPGENVIIIARGDLEGTSARVIETNGSDSVLVEPESRWEDPLFDPEAADAIQTKTTMILKQYELAVWDYDSVFKLDSELPLGSNTGVRESKQKLARLLSSLDDSKRRVESATKGADSSTTKQFVSSRERKAAISKKKKKK